MLEACFIGELCCEVKMALELSPLLGFLLSYQRPAASAFWSRRVGFLSLMLLGLNFTTSPMRMPPLARIRDVVKK